MNNPELEVFVKAIKAIRDLIDESEGVAGLHLNGDLATWDDLQKGGLFEEWLLDFNLAEYAIKISERIAK